MLKHIRHILCRLYRRKPVEQAESFLDDLEKSHETGDYKMKDQPPLIFTRALRAGSKVEVSCTLNSDTLDNVKFSQLSPGIFLINLETDPTSLSTEPNDLALGRLGQRRLLLSRRSDLVFVLTAQAGYDYEGHVLVQREPDQIGLDETEVRQANIVYGGTVTRTVFRIDMMHASSHKRAIQLHQERLQGKPERLTFELAREIYIALTQSAQRPNF